MKLYLSSYRIPVSSELAALLGKPLSKSSVALIPNAKDYYSERPRDLKVRDLVAYMEQFGLKAEVVDLRDYANASTLKKKLAAYDLIWSMGGNTYMLRYEMHRSGFEEVIQELLEAGVVYGGDSAGALVAGSSIAGVESADEPEFAKEVIKEGLRLVPFAVLPHVDNPEFSGIVPGFVHMHGAENVIKLKDSQAVIFTDSNHRIVEAADTATPKG